MPACSGVDGPQLAAVTPAAAARGATVTLVGDGFCPGDPTCAAPVGDVSFGLEPPAGAVITRWTATELDVLVPQSIAPGSTEIFVTIDGRSSGTLAFEVLP